ncbi:hypothetical protein K7432_009033 [Basidiobolus ranarum]|uniref:Uncharacterized protein n=1 Tax=Basidiobolus ranarum TaxID=34480 RepID=A0ABR2VXR6_9FUNG
MYEFEILSPGEYSTREQDILLALSHCHRHSISTGHDNVLLNYLTYPEVPPSIAKKNGSSSQGSEEHMHPRRIKEWIDQHLTASYKLPVNHLKLAGKDDDFRTVHTEANTLLIRHGIIDFLSRKSLYDSKQASITEQYLMAEDDDLFLTDYHVSTQYLELYLDPSFQMTCVRVDRFVCDFHGLLRCSSCDTTGLVNKVQAVTLSNKQKLYTHEDETCTSLNIECQSDREDWITLVMNSIRSGECDGSNDSFYTSSFVTLCNILRNPANIARRAELDKRVMLKYKAATPTRLQPIEFLHSRSRQMKMLAKNMHMEAATSSTTSWNSKYIVAKLGQKYCEGVTSQCKSRTTDFSSAIKTAWSFIIRLLSCYYASNSEILMSGDMAMFILAADYIGSPDETNSKHVSDFCSQSGALTIPAINEKNAFTYAVLGYTFMCMAYNNNPQENLYASNGSAEIITPSEFRRMRQSDVAMHALLTIDWYLRTGSDNVDTDVGSETSVNSCPFSMSCYLTSYRYDDIIDAISDISCNEMMNECALVMTADINQLSIYSKATCDNVRLLTMCKKSCAIHLHAVRYEMSCCIYYALNPRFTTLLQVMDISWNSDMYHHFQNAKLTEIYDMTIFIPCSGTLFHDNKWHVQGETHDIDLDQLVSILLLRASESEPSTQLSVMIKDIFLESANILLSINSLVELMWTLFTAVHCGEKADCPVCASSLLRRGLEAVLPTIIPMFYTSISPDGIDDEVVNRYNYYVDCIVWLTEVGDIAAIQALNGVVSFMLIESKLSPYKIIPKDIQSILR